MRYLWYSMYAFATALAVYALFFRPTAPAPSPAETPAPTAIVDEAPPATDKVDVQIALLLDTSSSMDGLVAQARTQVWDMVAEMQLGADKKERTVSVALYQYGNNRLSREQGFIEQLTPLTSDLDQVTVKLHSISTSGGKEHAPEAILRAVEELEWSDDDSVERLIVVAGNEGFQQGPISGSVALAAAEKKQIKVLPIFCANQGASMTAVASWRGAAELAGTDFSSIDPDQEVAKIDTPYDREILQKYQELEKTQIYGDSAPANPYAAEAQQYNVGAVAIDRAVVQSRQSSKDIVASFGGGNFQLTAQERKKLPKALQDKSADEQSKILQSNFERRAALKAEISELSAKRQSHMTQSADFSARAEAPSSLGSSFKQGAKSSR